MDKDVNLYIFVSLTHKVTSSESKLGKIFSKTVQMSHKNSKSTFFLSILDWDLKWEQKLNPQSRISW